MSTGTLLSIKHMKECLTYTEFRTNAKLPGRPSEYLDHKISSLLPLISSRKRIFKINCKLLKSETGLTF